MQKREIMAFTILLAALMLGVLLTGALAHHFTGPARLVLLLAIVAYVGGIVRVVTLQRSSDVETTLKLMQAFALPSAAVAGMAVALVLMLQ